MNMASYLTATNAMLGTTLSAVLHSQIAETVHQGDIGTGFLYSYAFSGDLSLDGA